MRRVLSWKPSEERACEQGESPAVPDVGARTGLSEDQKLTIGLGDVKSLVTLARAAGVGSRREIEQRSTGTCEFSCKRKGRNEKYL